MPAVAYRFSMDFVSRGNTRGRTTSAVAKAAYNAREKIHDQAHGITYDFRSKGGLEWAGLFLPEGSPEAWRDRGALWNAAEFAEAKKDGTLRVRGQTARTVDLALPADLTPQEMKQVLTDFAREEWQRKGIVADLALHQPDIDGSDKNWHVHGMLATRHVTPEGFGEKIRGDWKTYREFEQHREAELNHYKERFAELCANRMVRKAEALENEGLTVEAAALHVTAERWRYGHLTIEGQREKALERGDLDYIDMLRDGPTQHRGPKVSGIEARGEVSQVLQERQEQKEQAQERAPEAANDNLYSPQLPELRAQLAEIEAQEAELLRDIQRENLSRDYDSYLDAQKKIDAWEAALDASAIAKETLNRSFTDDKARTKSPDPIPERELSPIAADIRLAYGLSNGAAEFQEGLAERGYWLAQVSERDLVDLTFERERAREQGQYRPEFVAGEFVAVNSLGHLYSLSRLTTGESRADVADFLRPLEGKADIKDVTFTRNDFAFDWQQAREDRAADHMTLLNLRADNASIASAIRDTKGAAAGALERSAASFLDAGEMVIKAAEMIAEPIAAAVERVADFGGASKPTKEQVQARVDARDEQKEAKAFDFSRYMKEQDYVRQVMERETRETAARDEREREDREKRERGRDR